MVDIHTLLQIFWTGISTATYGVLLAAAFSLVLKVVKVWNFAQAGMMGIAYYTMYLAIQRFGLPAPVGIAAGLAVTIAAALAMEVYGLQTFRRRHSPSLTYFIFTLVVSEFVQYMLAMLFGTEPVSLAATLMSESTLVGGIMVSRWDLTALCTTAVLMAALYVLLKKTRHGKFMVAVSDNPHLSRLYGINVRPIYALTFVVASVLVCAAMYLFGTRASMVPNTPLEMMLFAVIAALLGGMGNVFGAAWAALFLALLRAFSILVIPSAWQGLILYALLFITILLFPNGVKLRLPRRAAPAVATVASA
ncbi:branched-chain amino acid ABC transporter permease [Variovorax sp. J31P207]|uniref:branched-chain amino acid ABC transporter permease n=1 Tax=Variovorax sp. J31P207 TaxID=3053510 RepID=UPI002578C380|nr:branched-chain amino acid ABC transporter permease [Variovorax sp. J31P207]MDM0070637.1 branched-chain amino acid ABC transporter permease [Variovorax sp. J31P207]